MISNLGYAAIKKQASASVAVTPNVFVPYYKQGLNTNINMVEDNAVYGGKFKNYDLLRGQRSHGGQITIMAEPDTAGYALDMLMTKGSTTGSDPYTHPFTLSSTDPNYYTVDISLGLIVERFIGVQASRLTPVWNEDEMQFDMDLSALKSFYGREIASVSTNTLTLKTDYDPTPTDGLVADDLVSIHKADGSIINTTVSSLTGTTVTVASAGSGVADGDMLFLRPQTVSLSNKHPFLWPRTEFRFGDDASEALTATQTRLEKGTDISLEHMFEDNNGARRSGSFDPAALVRTVGNATFKAKIFFENGDEIKSWNAQSKRALVMRSFSGSGYEFRITLNNIKPKTNDTPTESEGVIYHEVDFGVMHDASDGQAVSATVINSVSSI